MSLTQYKSTKGQWTLLHSWRIGQITSVKHKGQIRNEIIQISVVVETFPRPFRDLGTCLNFLIVRYIKIPTTEAIESKWFEHWKLRDLSRPSFPVKCIFSSYLNLKTTPNFVHVQSQVCTFYYDACYRLDLNLIASLFQHRPKCEVSETVSTTTLIQIASM